MRTTDDAPGAAQLLTQAQVAHRFNVSRSTISRWTSDGTLAAVRIGKGIVRYDTAEVERAITEHAS